MNFPVRRLCISLFLAALSFSSAFAQKVKVGYDRGVDFTRYSTYTWTEPDVPPTRPMVYAAVVGAIDYTLKSKGLERAQNDGDLLLVPAGAIEFSSNSAAAAPILPTYSGPPPVVDATMWTGAGGYTRSLTTYVPEGTLELTFVDRRANKIIWTGSTTVKLDIEHKSKSLELINKSIVKLLKDFPPAKQ